MPPPAPGRPDSALRLPSPALADCVRAFYWHDLRPCAGALSLDRRLTRVPPGPYHGLVWMIEGQAVLVECGGQPVEQPLPPVFVACAHRHPYRAMAISPYCSFGLALQPAVLAQLTGRDLGGELDRIRDAREVLPPDWHAWLDEIPACATHAERIAACERFLLPRWQAQRARQAGWGELARCAWHRASHGPLAGAWAWTARHFQRRTRQMVGMSPGEVERLLRLERALLDVRDGRASVADAAAAHGYCDQPHLSRETRASFGDSPRALQTRLGAEGDDEDWLLRL